MSPRFKKINALPFTYIHNAETEILQKNFGIAMLSYKDLFKILCKITIDIYNIL